MCIDHLINDISPSKPTNLSISIQGDILSKKLAFIEFRLWKQGKLNLDVLTQKLKATVEHANWDLLTEFNFLPIPLCEPIGEISKPNLEVSDEIDSNYIDDFEAGNDGKLIHIYHTVLPYWMQFGLELSVPAVKKHLVSLERRHPVPIILKELQNLIQNCTKDMTPKSFVQCNSQPFADTYIQDDILLSKIVDGVDGNVKWLSQAIEFESKNDSRCFPWNPKKHEKNMGIKSIFIARNFKQWKAFNSKNSDFKLQDPKGTFSRIFILLLFYLQT